MTTLGALKENKIRETDVNDKELIAVQVPAIKTCFTSIDEIAWIFSQVPEPIYRR